MNGVYRTVDHAEVACFESGARTYSRARMPLKCGQVAQAVIVGNGNNIHRAMELARKEGASHRMVCEVCGDAVIAAQRTGDEPV